MQRIENVEELFLGLFLSTEELDVVNDQQIDLAIEKGEVADAVVLDSLNELIRKALAGDVKNICIGAIRVQVVSYGLNKVGLAQADASVQKKWIEARPAGLLGYGKRCTPSQSVAISFDEAIKRIDRVQAWIGPNLLNSGNDERVADGRRHTRGPNWHRRGISAAQG